VTSFICSQISASVLGCVISWSRGWTIGRSCIRITQATQLL